MKRPRVTPIEMSEEQEQFFIDTWENVHKRDGSFCVFFLGGLWIIAYLCIII